MLLLSFAFPFVTIQRSAQIGSADELRKLSASRFVMSEPRPSGVEFARFALNSDQLAVATTFGDHIDADVLVRRTGELLLAPLPIAPHRRFVDIPFMDVRRNLSREIFQPYAVGA